MSPSSFSFWILLIFQTPWDVLEKDLQMAVKEKEKVGKKVVGTFLKPYFIWTKVPQSFWILVILPYFPWKMSKPKQKKYLIIFGIRQPPPSLPEKFPNSSKKVPQHFWNKVTPPPFPEKFPNTSRKAPQKVWY